MENKQLSELTRELRKNGLTDQNRKKIRELHDSLNHSGSPSGSWSGTGSGSQSGTAEDHRAAMMERQKNPGPFPGLNRSNRKEIITKNLAPEAGKSDSMTLPKGDFRR